MIIDTHSHIYYDKYNLDIDEVINRAIDADIKKIICVSVDLPSVEKCFKLSEKFPLVYMTAGIHPHEADKVPKDYLKQIESFLNYQKTVGLGEIGLDYHYNFSDPNIQLPIYIEQLELAKTYNLPAVIHCREAENDILEGIISTKSNKGVIHCFSGNYNFAKNILNTGYKISFTGLITFTGDSFKKVIEKVNLSDIMVETDSPYLTPKPNRGKRNEPKNIRYVVDQISKWKNLPFEEIAAKTTKTAYNVFPKLKN
jgi:TatD DNase family protein